MDKPENYAFYSNRRKNKIPYKDWPKECKEYAIWIRNIRRHPEWKNLSDEDYYKALEESKKQRGRNNIKKWHEKYNEMSLKEREEIDKKKGNKWKNLSEEEKEEESKRLKKISQDFWKNLSAEEKGEFIEYRTLKSEKTKSEYSEKKKKDIFQNRSNRSKKIWGNLSPEQKAEVILRLNEGRKNKRENDEEFRKSQDELLRKHNKEYFDKMSDEEKKEFYQSMIKKGHEALREKIDNDPKYKKRQREFLKEIGKLGNQKTQELWKTDPEFRERAMAHIHEMNQITRDLWATDEEFRKSQTKKGKDKFRKFFDSLTKEELYNILKYNKFNRKFEDMFNNSSLSDNFYYTREYKVTVDGVNKFWDYAIYDNNDKLIMVVDLDGAYYHGDNSDYNGIQSQEEFDERRHVFIPDGVKVQIIEEYSISDGFKEMFKSLLLDYEKYIDEIFNSVYMSNFPFQKYSFSELHKSFSSLINMNLNNKYLKISTNTRLGDRLINHFHHSIYAARCKNKPSPLSAWYDKNLLRKCIENRVIYRNKLNSHKILQGFNICKLAPKVSVFSAGRAKLIINKYLNGYNEIFDPFSGFSGRLLGAVTSYKKYIGQDISKVHVEESNELIQQLKIFKTSFPEIIIPTVIQKDIFNSSGTYETLFTCPPYGNKEIWEDAPETSLSCDEWIDICLKNFKCKRYVFVVDKTIKYESNITEIIPNKSHFGNNNEYIIVIDK